MTTPSPSTEHTPEHAAEHAPEPKAKLSPELYRPRGGPVRLAATALRTARSQPVLSVIVALIAAGVVVLTLLTAGRAVSTERAVLARFDDSDFTVITILDDQGNAGLDAEAVDRLSRLGGVSWVLGLGPVVDTRVAGMRSDPVPARTVVGSSPLLHLSGHTDGAAYVSAETQRALGLEVPSGALDEVGGDQLPVMGSFTASGTLASLASSVILVDREFTGPVRRIYLSVTHPQDVVAVSGVVTAVTGGHDGNAPRVEVAEDVALVREAVQGELGGASRATVLQALAAGLVLGAITIYAGVQARRRDFGRRRALGATRTQLVGLVVLQMVAVALPGAVLGAVGGAYAAYRLAGSWPGWTYPIAVATLTVLAIAVAALPPAVLAAYRDPVTALRVP